MNFLLNLTKVSTFCWSIHAWLCQQLSDAFLILQTFLQAILHPLQIYSGSLRALGFGLYSVACKTLHPSMNFFDADFTIKYDYMNLSFMFCQIHFLNPFCQKFCFTLFHYFFFFFNKTCNSRTLQSTCTQGHELPNYSCRNVQGILLQSLFVICE